MGAFVLLCLGDRFYTPSERYETSPLTLEEHLARNLPLVGLRKHDTIRTELRIFITRVESSAPFTRLGNDPKLRETLTGILAGYPSAAPIDFFVLTEEAYFTRKKFVAFDLDSTLIACEGIDEFAREMGAHEKVSAITERAMRGEIDFIRSFEERVACLEGLTRAQIEAVRGRTDFTPGALELLRGIEKFGADSAIFSGGFEPLADLVKKKARVRFVHTNCLEMAGDACTGRSIPPVIDGAQKAFLLRDHMLELGLKPNEVIAIGDGSNDIPMLQTAGVGISYRGKEKVNLVADGVLRNPELNRLLALLS